MSVMTVDEASFEQEVLAAGSRVLVLFSKDGTTSRGEPNASSKMSAFLTDFAATYQGPIKILRKEFVEKGPLEEKYKVESAPTTEFFQNGERVAELELVGNYANSSTFANKIEALEARA